MPTWPDIQTFTRAQFNIHEDQERHIVVDMPLDGRSQMVIINYLSQPNQGEWIVLQSAFATLGTVDLGRVLLETRNMWFAGVALLLGNESDNVLALRRATPLATLRMDELMQSLILLANFADRLERKLGNLDEF